MRYLVVAIVVCLGMSTADAQVFHLRGTKVIAAKAGPVAAAATPAPTPVAARGPAPRVTAQPANDTPRPKKKAPKKTRKSSDDDDVVIVEDE